MKIFCATLSHETNPFSPIPTNIDSFREFYLYLPGTGEGEHFLEEDLECVNLYRTIKNRGHEVICGLAASAQPSMPTVRRDYEYLRDELLACLRTALPVDAIMLFLHGAQMAEGYDDCEGDLLARIRAMAGPHVPIGVIFDLHGNISPAMLENADILMACKEYPHTDFPERAEQLLDLIERTVQGEIKPLMQSARVPMLGTYFTTRQPMRDFVDRCMQMEGKDGILSISLCHGFCWANTKDTGAMTIVISDADEAKAVGLADRLAADFFRLRNDIRTRQKSIDEVLDEAMGIDQGPVVIADMPDNPGAGAAGDATFLLEAVLKRGIKNVALAMLCDPVAVQIAQAAGVGACIPLRIGGKAGPHSGRPLDVEATIIASRNDGAQAAQGMRVPFGPAVAIETNGVQIVLNTIRNQTFTPECFTGFGIDPVQKHLLIVKSHQHFHEHFADLASSIIYASPPGTANMNFNSDTFTDIQRPVFPIDNPPFFAFNKNWE